MRREPRIDAYIARARPFAQQILTRVRERVHALVPDIEEAVKWSHPTYCRNGKIVLGTAAFKEHVTVNFWRGQELGLEAKEGAMGQLGKLTSIDDLPVQLDAIIAQAASIANEPSRRRLKRAPRPLPEIPPEFAAALDKAPKAKSVFGSFPPTQRREYLEWISEAKRDSTREKRIASAVEWLTEGKRRNWKYENC